jgi:hypothetical protein
MYLDAEANRRGWYGWPDGVAYRNLCYVLGWRVRLFDFGPHDPWMRRGIEVAHPVHVAVRFGLISSMILRPLMRAKLYWPQVGSGYWKVALACDVFVMAVRGWHDDGEASYLS